MDSELNINESVTVENEQENLKGPFEQEYSLAVEALLFASPMPLSDSHLARIIGIDKKRIAGIIEFLNTQYVEWGRSFRIEHFGEGYRLYSIPEFDKYISRLGDIPRPARLSKAALEVLALIAYKQPMVKSDIDKIRGIDSSGVIRTLVERGLVIISGRSDAPGRPLLYKTTPEFLEFFGISDLAELPTPELSEEEMLAPRNLTLVRPPENTESDSNLDEA